MEKKATMLSKSNQIIITGQTGTGKTSFGVQIAKKNNAIILSADSRQIYKQMDIGTGKFDKASDLVFQNNQWQLQGVPIYGINLINPEQYFSSADFAEYSTDLLNNQSNTVIVGGTGFYIKTLFDPDNTITTPQDSELRNKYSIIQKQYSLPEFVQILQKDLSKLNLQKLNSMNNSDKNNPRRLVRAIEVQLSSTSNKVQTVQKLKKQDQIWIGLYAPKEYLKDRITSRVEQMIENGLENEVKELSEKYSWETSSMQTIGYIEWKDYFENKISIQELKNNIITSHTQYARKQMIYLKRFNQIKWIDISLNDISSLSY